MRTSGSRAAVMLCVTAVMGMPAVAQAAPSAGADAPVVSYERGHVISCSGKAGERSVTVDLYDNSLYGSFAELHVEGPDGEFGGGATPDRLFRGGSVRTEIPVRHLGEEESPAGVARIVGLYAESGPFTPVHDVYKDNGWTIVSDGTHRQLRTRMVISLLDHTTRLTCGEAFAYDLKVTKTPL
ncbi:hypothetical protein ACF064_32575 [Streptomyces sp. NPDC015492]|uniref:hypothetical protein n=1 Tax=Streptomyces sp. NPDC015492 TaxID=3364958 RepID=UPI0036F998DA